MTLSPMSISRNSHTGEEMTAGPGPAAIRVSGERRLIAAIARRRRFLRFLSRRLAQAVVTVVLIAVVNFLILQLAPGDVADVLAGEAGAGDAGYVAALRERFGLDQPLPVQLGRYLLRVAQLDLGYSFRQNMPVFDLITQRVPATLLLMLASLGIAFLGGIILGTASARRVNSLTDNVISVLALLAYATPLFWLGLMLLIVFTLKLHLLPSTGMVTVGADQTLLGQSLDVSRHLILPAATLSLFYMATYTRLMRASMLEVMGMDYVRTARAKGISHRRVMYRHVLRNAMMPMVTMLGVQVSSLLGGAVVVEVVFGWPGLGRLAFESIFQRDFNLLLGILLLSSLLVIVTNILVDLLYTRLDPRIELDE
jgi:peptide/nickel transport system permease protein